MLWVEFAFSLAALWDEERCNKGQGLRRLRAAQHR